jgi:UDP-glucose 4-epimerase
LRSNLEQYSECIQIVEGDITALDTCVQASRGCDIIFHLAADISVPRSIQEPYDCFHTNVQGTLNMLEAARRNQVPRFIFSSSAAVYGPHEGICTETTPCDPTSPYGTSKLLGELLCKQYATSYAISIACLRYFNVYGERQRHDLPHAGIVARLTHAFENNEPITIYGDGTQQRDFVSVNEVVAANLWCGMYAEPSWRGEIFNVASGSAMSIRALLQKLHAKYPSYDMSLIKFELARTGDIRYSAANCAKLRSSLTTL